MGRLWRCAHSPEPRCLQLGRWGWAGALECAPVPAKLCANALPRSYRPTPPTPLHTCTP